MKRALAYSYLATGKISANSNYKTYLNSGDRNTRFAQAILALVEGKEADAKNLLQNLAGENRYATMILGIWKQ